MAVKDMVRRLVGSTETRYVLVGAWNTLFGIGLFALLLHTMGHYVGYGWVLLLAQVVAVIQAHFSQRKLVWRSHGRFLPELGRFSVVYVVTYFVNLGLLALCVEVLGWPVLASQVIITIVLVITTFAVNRTWTFRRMVPDGSPAGNAISARE